MFRHEFKKYSIDLSFCPKTGKKLAIIIIIILMIIIKTINYFYIKVF
jgi:hypothetical protein